MDNVETVGASIDNDFVTQDVGRIDVSQVLGRHVQYVIRADARVLTERDDGGSWRALVDSPTLFLYVDGIKFRHSQCQ